jgi:hypothetical protein
MRLSPMQRYNNITKLISFFVKLSEICVKLYLHLYKYIKKITISHSLYFFLTFNKRKFAVLCEVITKCKVFGKILCG